METVTKHGRSNGADDSFIETLQEHGFKSRLTLSYLDVQSQEGQRVLADLNFGQRCLLQGLVLIAKMAATPKHLSTKSALPGAAGPSNYDTARALELIMVGCNS